MQARLQLVVLSWCLTLATLGTSPSLSAQTSAQPGTPLQLAPAVRAVPLSSAKASGSAAAIPAMTSPAQSVAGGQEPTTTPEAASSPEAAAEAALAQLEQQQLQQLNALSFKRTPSSILAAWKALELPSQPAAISEPLPEDAEAEDPAVEAVPPAAPSAAAGAPDEKNPLRWPADRFQKYLTGLQHYFALSRWEDLDREIKQLPEPQRLGLLMRMLNALGSDVPVDELTQLRMQTQTRGMDPRVLEKQRVSFDDVLGLATLIEKRPLLEPALQAMGRAFAASIKQGRAREELVELLAEEVAKPENQQLVSKRQAAQLLVFTKELPAAAQFLPTLEEAISSNDFEALNLLSEILDAKYAASPKAEILEQAWRATLAVLANAKVEDRQNLTAITQAVSLASRVRKELGQQWLESSFTTEPQRGIAILGSIGEQSARALSSRTFDEASRLELLKLQNSAVEALLKANPELAKQWSEILELLAGNWVSEVGISYTDDLTTTFGPQMRRDLYGNIFYYDESMGEMPNRGQRVNPIRTTDLLEARPSDGWINLLDPSLRPKYWYSLAQLYLKVGEESLALPFIEQLGQTHPRLAKDLVREFLSVWTKNHDPNSEKKRSNPYMFMYGFESKAESIPLTRSKQVRNLEELSQLVPRLRELNGEDLDSELLVSAFLTSHSFAEVYKTEDLERVFGPMATIPPKVIAQLAQKMRENLASVWREVDVQKQAKTKRSRKEVEAEVMSGYKAANELLATAAARHPEDPSLLTLKAALLHDENGYQAELKSSPEFAPRRRAAFDVFRQAAEAYAKQLESLEPDQRNTEVFERWFYAALGACDLKLVDEKQVADETQYGLIRAAIDSLPAGQADWHLSRFANLLFTRMSSAKPAVKSRYLRGGFAIVGDHPQARQARDVFDYYNDLVTEIKLETTIDGSDRVGTDPFGVYVNLLHTREIERESGGFGRYLQNQNNNNQFVYNYGRPLENYRDKFEEFVRGAMQEHFEILSVTFQVPEVNSRTAQPEGWRRTPYAYILLKARGAQVDRLPPLKLDLDFLDTSGYAILPIESPAQQIDCDPANCEPRPSSLTNLTQILDERQADKGELLVEIKASGHGLMPDLKTIFPDLKYAGFELGEVEDNGVSISRFDPESSDSRIISERGWIVHLKAEPNASNNQRQFSFASPAVEAKEIAYQRYVDADLQTVEASLPLKAVYAQPGFWRSFWPWIIAGVPLLTGLALFGRRLLPGPTVAQTARQIPEELTPFQAIALLQDLEQSERLDTALRAELQATIADLELRYFDTAGPSPLSARELRMLAERWLSKA